MNFTYTARPQSLLRAEMRNALYFAVLCSLSASVWAAKPPTSPSPSVGVTQPGRGDLFAKRRKMMQEWADYVNKQQAEVIPLNKHA